MALYNVIFIYNIFFYIFIFVAKRPGGLGYSETFYSLYRGMLRPDSRPLTLSHSKFRKIVPLSHDEFRKFVPLSHAKFQKIDPITYQISEIRTSFMKKVPLSHSFPGKRHPFPITAA